MLLLQTLTVKLKIMPDLASGSFQVFLYYAAHSALLLQKRPHREIFSTYKVHTFLQQDFSDTCGF